MAVGGCAKNFTKWNGTAREFIYNKPFDVGVGIYVVFNVAERQFLEWKFVSHHAFCREVYRYFVLMGG